MVIYAAHRLIWKMMLDTEPPPHLDHHDGDSLNNRWVNLRPANDHLNAANRVHTKSSGGYKGVYRKGSIFYASIKVGQKQQYLGSFKTPEEAHATYAKAARQCFGAYYRTH
jgi:HNH endonuclease